MEWQWIALNSVLAQHVGIDNPSLPDSTFNTLIPKPTGYFSDLIRGEISLTRFGLGLGSTAIFNT
jgi:hypothetical protein